MASALLKALAEEADREEEVDLSQDLGTHAQYVFFPIFYLLIYSSYISTVTLHPCGREFIWEFFRNFDP